MDAFCFEADSWWTWRVWRPLVSSGQLSWNRLVRDLCREQFQWHCPYYSLEDHISPSALFLGHLVFAPSTCSRPFHWALGQLSYVHMGHDDQTVQPSPTYPQIHRHILRPLSLSKYQLDSIATWSTLAYAPTSLFSPGQDHFTSQLSAAIWYVYLWSYLSKPLFHLSIWPVALWLRQ